MPLWPSSFSGGCQCRRSGELFPSPRERRRMSVATRKELNSLAWRCRMSSGVEKDRIQQNSV